MASRNIPLPVEKGYSLTCRNIPLPVEVHDLPQAGVPKVEARQSWLLLTGRAGISAGYPYFAAVDGNVGFNQSWSGNGSY